MSHILQSETMAVRRTRTSKAGVSCRALLNDPSISSGPGADLRCWMKYANCTALHRILVFLARAGGFPGRPVIVFPRLKAVLSPHAVGGVPGTYV